MHQTGSSLFGPATTEIYTLSLHDALPIFEQPLRRGAEGDLAGYRGPVPLAADESCMDRRSLRSEEHTSELQSHVNLVCRLLLEKKKKKHDCPLPLRTGTTPPQRLRKRSST